MGRMQREKGKRFERQIAAMLRARWPDAIVRRASQAERADNPDVFIEGGPPILARLWLELQDARMPTPLVKLAQARRDIAAYLDARHSTNQLDRLPVVVWHRLGERMTYVTTHLWVLDAIREQPVMLAGPPVTMWLEDFLVQIDIHHTDLRKVATEAA